MEDAPGRLFTMKVCFRPAPTVSPSARAAESAFPPAGYGTTMRMGCLAGHSCAWAVALNMSPSAITAQKLRLEKIICDSKVSLGVSPPMVAGESGVRMQYS